MSGQRTKSHRLQLGSLHAATKDVSDKQIKIQCSQTSNKSKNIKTVPKQIVTFMYTIIKKKVSCDVADCRMESRLY